MAPGFYIYMALLLLLVPLRWLGAIALSILVHELGHILALRWMKVPVNAVHINPMQIRLLTAPLEPLQETVCAAAGPLAGLALVLLAKWLPATALCAAFHCLYNLLPIYPADGGRVFSGFAKLLFSDGTACRVIKTVEYLVGGLLAAISVYAAFVLELRLLPVVIGAVVLAGARKRK